MIPEIIYDAEFVTYEDSSEKTIVLVVRAAGVEHRLPAATLTTTSAGMVGVVRLVEVTRTVQPAYRFETYLDQTLRRAPDLDGPDAERVRAGRNPNTVGWRCAARPDGFRAPAGLIPGKDGRFLPDNSVAVTVRVPAEFVQEAERYGMTPDELLQGFAIDLAGISNWNVQPRADGFSSNGSDEREMADAWLERAYAYRLEDAEKAEAAAEEAEEAEAERADFGLLLDDWIMAGGDAQDLRAAVEQMIAAKEAETNPKERSDG